MNSFDLSKTKKAIETELEICNYILTKYDELEKRIQKLEEIIKKAFKQ